jgi:hypothetical protein
MERKNTLIALIILGLIIVGMFVFAYLKKSEIENTAPVTSAPQTDTTSPYAGITRIDAKHFYIDGMHTVAGEMMMPTPCDLLNWNARVQESSPETAVIDFDVINNSEMCTQVVTPQRFKVSFKASKDAAIRATLEGRSVELNLIPAGLGETPDDFELFIKG